MASQNDKEESFLTILFAILFAAFFSMKLKEFHDVSGWALSYPNILNIALAQFRFFALIFYLTLSICSCIIFLRLVHIPSRIRILYPFVYGFAPWILTHTVKLVYIGLADFFGLSDSFLQKNDPTIVDRTDFDWIITIIFLTLVFVTLIPYIIQRKKIKVKINPIGPKSKFEYMSPWKKNRGKGIVGRMNSSMLIVTFTILIFLILFIASFILIEVDSAIIGAYVIAFVSLAMFLLKEFYFDPKKEDTRNRIAEIKNKLNVHVLLYKKAYVANQRLEKFIQARPQYDLDNGKEETHVDAAGEIIDQILEKAYLIDQDILDSFNELYEKGWLKAKPLRVNSDIKEFIELIMKRYKDIKSQYEKLKYQ